MSSIDPRAALLLRIAAAGLERRMPLDGYFNYPDPRISLRELRRAGVVS